MPDLYTSSQPKEAPKEEVKKSTERNFLPPPGGHCLSSLLVLPKKTIRFDTQDLEEEILLILRRHWITNVIWFFMAVVLFFAPMVLSFFPLLVSFPEKYRLVFVIIWYLILLMFVFEKFLTWFFNMTIITDERIVDIDFINLTTKKVSDCELDKIQDVSFTNSGAFGTIFNYGNVMVQTAAEIVEFVFEDVPRPAKVAEVLQKLRTEEKIEALEGRIR